MDYKCITKLSELVDYINGADILAFDIETSPHDSYRSEERASLDAHKASITGISFSVGEGSARYVPLRHRVGSNADIQPIMGFLSLLLTDSKITKVAHNLAFEAMFFASERIIIQPPVYDTIAASQLTLKSETEFRKLSDSGLKQLSASLFNADMPEYQAVTNGRHFDEMDPQEWETIRYACADSDYTLRLYHLFNKWFDTYLPRHRYITEQVESPTAVYCGLMKYNGLLVDEELMLMKKAEAETKLEKLREDISFITGDVDIGANASTAAFKQYLFKDLGLPVFKTTAKYKEAADDEVMISLKEWCGEHRPHLVHLFELIQEYRKWGKLKSTYIDGYLDHINSATGRIHPSLLPLGTDTGRFAARTPNLQNMPRADGDEAGVRDFFIAPPGKVLLSLDFSQIELRVGAFYCRDEKMLETYRKGGDIHAQTTSVIYHIPFEQSADKNAPHYKERRTIAKNCNFGVFYGLFANGLQRTLRFKAGLDITKQDCEVIIDNLKAGYPGLTKWQKETIKTAANNRHIETWLGRRRYIIGIISTDWGTRSFAERCALNTPIQGTAADILKLACGRIITGLPERPWLKPLLQIHDELVFELPSDKVYEAVEFIKSSMEEKPFLGFDVPIVAEAATGISFGSLKELEV